MKTLIFALFTLLGAPSAHALTICAGETHGNTIVTVTIYTNGAIGSLHNGIVTISPPGQASSSYPLAKEEIPQFYETSFGEPKQAFVGLSAYVVWEFPVSIHYSGTNFQDDLTTVLRDPKRVMEKGNEMRVWKGPGYPAEQQHQFKDVVCQVTVEP